MITIYHNPRCRKSREGLSLLENSGKDFEVVKYMEDPISEEKLKYIITLLKVEPIKLVRKNEAIWKSDYKEKTLSNDELISIWLANPKLIERPIVVNGNKAIVGRPASVILNII